MPDITDILSSWMYEGKKAIATWVLILSTIIYGTNGLAYRETFSNSICRPHGFLNHTELRHYVDGAYVSDTVETGNPFVRTIAHDGGIFGKNDGLVDRIHKVVGISYPCAWSLYILDREKDYAGNEKKFEEQDKVLAEAKERFKYHFNR